MKKIARSKKLQIYITPQQYELLTKLADFTGQKPTRLAYNLVIQDLEYLDEEIKGGNHR